MILELDKYCLEKKIPSKNISGIISLDNFIIIATDSIIKRFSLINQTPKINDVDDVSDGIKGQQGLKGEQGLKSQQREKQLKEEKEETLYSLKCSEKICQVIPHRSGGKFFIVTKDRYNAEIYIYDIVKKKSEMIRRLNLDSYDGLICSDSYIVTYQNESDSSKLIWFDIYDNLKPKTEYIYQSKIIGIKWHESGNPICCYSNGTINIHNIRKNIIEKTYEFDNKIHEFTIINSHLLIYDGFNISVINIDTGKKLRNFNTSVKLKSLQVISSGYGRYWDFLPNIDDDDSNHNNPIDTN